MKTKMKRQESTELPRFAVGALAIAGASAANAATVQISFANNIASMVTGNSYFVADLTGDGINENIAAGVSASYVSIKELTPSGQFLRYLGRAANFSTRNVQVGNGSWINQDKLRALVAFSFSDARINGGLVTSGFLDIESDGSDNGGPASVQIHRLIFNDSSTTAPTGVTSATTGLSAWSAVPEPSSLGLLALGAGGLLARRRRSQAA